MGSSQTMQPTNGLITIPSRYPTIPTPGKIEILTQYNSKSIYHRYSPYADYDGGSFLYRLLDFGAKQPFIWSYIDEAKKGLNGLKRYESRLFPVGSAPLDVIRLSKFIGSGAGVIFLGSQFLLQAANVFDETRLYNPTSPIVAAGMSLALGTVRPQRNFDLSGGLGGIARTLIGNTIPNLFGAGTVGVPSSTAGAQALPDANKKTDGKGLIRGDTAGTGYAHFTSKWAGPNTSKFSWKEFGKQVINAVIPNTFRKSQPPGTIYRGDEGSYGIMVDAGLDKFYYIGASGGTFLFNQKWVAGGKGIRKSSQYSLYPSLLLPTPNGTTKEISADGGVFGNITGVGPVGYTIKESKVESKPGYRYGDSVGASKDEMYGASDVMVAYGEYADQNNQYPTKRIDKKSIDKTKENLRSLLNNLQKSGVYQVKPVADSRAMSSNEQTVAGYNRIFQATDGQPGKSPKEYPMGYLNAYRWKNVRMVDNSITDTPVQTSLKLPGAGNFDAINTLTVLPGENSENPRYVKFSQLPGWDKWEPYRDDQIAFYFYDIVNDKYLPFRATVTGINESATSAWDEMIFIGRADRLYSYGGFTRNLSFSFDIHISSVIELAPTWKRINYLMTMVKPSRYTKSNTNLNFNRFVVPPMILLTMGDLYKKHPIIIQTVGMSVPDDAIWETLNEFNTTSKEWNYLVDYFKSNKIKSNGLAYGQFPRTVKMTVSCIILEKDRPIMGAANFGHAPFTDEYNPMDIADQPYMHQALVEYQFDHAVTQKPADDKTTIQNPEPAQATSQQPITLQSSQQPRWNPLSPIDSLSKTNKVSQTSSPLPKVPLPNAPSFIPKF